MGEELGLVGIGFRCLLWFGMYLKELREANKSLCILCEGQMVTTGRIYHFLYHTCQHIDGPNKAIEALTSQKFPFQGAKGTVYCIPQPCDVTIAWSFACLLYQ